MKAKYDASFSRLLGYDKIVPRNQEGLEMLRAAVAAFDSVLRPADERSVLKALARLKISTAYRNQYEDDAEFERRVYVVELCQFPLDVVLEACQRDRKSTRLNSSHVVISYAVLCLTKKKKYKLTTQSVFMI